MSLALPRRAGIKLPPISGVQFATARRRAEETARLRSVEEFGTAEVTLAQIAEQLVISLGWDADDPALLAGLATAELAAEADALVADRELLALVREQAEAGRRMVVVSDTYLGPGDLASLLTGAGYPDRAFERIFVSSSYGVSKSVGLFEAVVDELAIHPTRLLHVGDNVGADVTPLRDLGGRSARWSIARDEAIEMTIREAGHGLVPLWTANVDGEPTGGDAGVTALRARLVPPDDATEPRDRILTGYERFGRLVYGPVLVGLANWICTRAAELGLERLYFFQREGDLLAELVDRVAAARAQSLHTRVLAVSRAALAPARYSRVGVDYLGDLIFGRRPRRAGEVLAEVGLDGVGLRGWSAERRITSADGEELFGLLEERPDLLATVQADLDRRRANLQAYLRGAVDIDTGEIGVVDLGWAGSIQRSLSHALAQIGFAGTIRGFYLATNTGAERHLSATNRNEGFVANLGYPEGFDAVFRNLEVIEQSCLERSGSVLGYGDDGSVLRAHDDIEPAQWHAIARVQDGVRSFLDEWIAHEPRTGVGRLDETDVWRVVARQILRRFCADPTPEEIELFRSWKHDDNKGTRTVEQMIPAVFDGAGAAGAMLADALEMDELLWAAAVTSSNGGARPSIPVGIGATVLDAGQGVRMPAITAVARRAEDLLVAYVGAEAVRLGAVDVALATGPAVVTVRRVTVEADSGDDTIVDRLASFGQFAPGRGTRVVGGNIAFVKGRTLRLRVPMSAYGSRISSPQRVRVLVEVEVKNFEPNPNRFVAAARARGTELAKRAIDRSVPLAVEMAKSAVRQPATRAALADARRMLLRLNDRRGPR